MAVLLAAGTTSKHGPGIACASRLGVLAGAACQASGQQDFPCALSGGISSVEKNLQPDPSPAAVSKTAGSIALSASKDIIS